MNGQRTRKNYILPLKILVSLVLLSWMFRQIKWSEIVFTLSHAHLVWVAAAFGWVVVSVLVSAYKWQLILRASSLELPFKVLWKSYWAGLFFNNFLPSSIGGDGLRIYWIGKHTQDLAGATASVVVERVLATAGLCLAALFAAPFSNTVIPQLIGFFLIILALSSFLILLILFPKLTGMLQSRLNSWPKAQRFLEGLNMHGNRLRKQPGLLVKALIGSIIFQFCVVMVNWSLFRALAVTQIAPFQAAFLIPATSVAAMIPIGINGYGVREGAYMALFARIGISSSAAVTVSVLFALIVSCSSLWGGWIWIKEGRRVHVNERVEIDNREPGRSLFQ